MGGPHYVTALTTVEQSSSLYAESLSPAPTANCPSTQQADGVDKKDENPAQIAAEAASPTVDGPYATIPVDSATPASTDYRSPDEAVNTSTGFYDITVIEAANTAITQSYDQIPVDVTKPPTTDYLNLDAVATASSHDYAQPAAVAEDSPTVAGPYAIIHVDTVRIPPATDYLNLDGVVTSTSTDYENLTEQPAWTTNNVYDQLQSEV